MSNTHPNLSRLTSEEFWHRKEEFQTALEKSPSPVLIKNDLISAFQVVNIFWKGIWKSILFPKIFRTWRGDKHRPWDQPQNSLLGGRFWNKPWKNQKEKWLVISGFCLQYNFAVIDAGRSPTSKDSFMWAISQWPISPKVSRSHSIKLWMQLWNYVTKMLSSTLKTSFKYAKTFFQVC